MQNRKKELEELIQKYLIGSITDVEREHLMKWMDDLNLSGKNQLEFDHVGRQMKKQIDARLVPADADGKIQAWSWKQWSQVAAVVLCCLSFGWYFLRGGQVEESRKIDYVVTKKTRVEPTKMICTVSRDSIVLLEDGTKVHLLANSTMTWSQPFPKEGRPIQLQGKAFFEVAHDKSRPFTVLTGNILTTALGTSFWILQENRAAKPKVRLVTGRVSVKERTENGGERLLVYLSPGQTWSEAKEPKRAGSIVQQNKPMDSISADTLVFHHKPLIEVLPALASFYHTTILFPMEEVDGLSFYGTYAQDNNIAQILQTICIANDLELSFNSATNTYTIKKSK